MPKIDFGKMDVYKFVVCVLAFVLIFCFVFMLQSKSIINMQNKLLAQYLDQKPVATQPVETTTTYTPTTPSSSYKY